MRSERRLQAKSLLAGFEEKLSSSEDHTAKLMAEVQTLMDEMGLLQRENQQVQPIP